MKKYKVAVLDDYQNVALESADWLVLRDRADKRGIQIRRSDFMLAVAMSGCPCG